MSIYSEATAIVTGAASGIGLALSKALIGRGAHVWLVDINSRGARAAAENFGPRAHLAELDVREAPAFSRIVIQVASERGTLDFLFNNAGISLTGEMHRFTVDHFNRIIDVNIRGVMNGIAAAYPLMVKQSHGYIVNTSSVGGLLPMPLVTPYSMTKHAIVGLSTSLRFEAAEYGVKICVLCPSAVDTPMLDTEGPEDLPKSWRPNIRRYLTRIGGPPLSADTFAEYALNKVEENHGVIILPTKIRLVLFLNQIAPTLVSKRVRDAIKAELVDRKHV